MVQYFCNFYGPLKQYCYLTILCLELLLHHRMCLQGGLKPKLNLQIQKAIRKYPCVLEKFNTTPEDVISKTINHDE